MHKEIKRWYTSWQNLKLPESFNDIASCGNKNTGTNLLHHKNILTPIIWMHTLLHSWYNRTIMGTQRDIVLFFYSLLSLSLEILDREHQLSSFVSGSWCSHYHLKFMIESTSFLLVSLDPGAPISTWNSWLTTPVSMLNLLILLHIIPCCISWSCWMYMITYIFFSLCILFLVASFDLAALHLFTSISPFCTYNSLLHLLIQLHLFPFHTSWSCCICCFCCMHTKNN